MNDSLCKILLVQIILIARATYKHEESDEDEFLRVRKELLDEQSLKLLWPSILKTSRILEQFWGQIKKQFDNYEEWRNFIWSEFQPILDKLEQNNLSPSDQIINQTIQKLDSVYIHQNWTKALERRSTDPEGAITIARTLLESTCKHILDEAKVIYGDAPDLNDLYKLVAKQLNIAPSQHTQPIFKQILGWCTAVVEGLGALRNRVGDDAHGQGKTNFKPSARHTELAVNLAGTLAVFLFSTWDMKNESLE